MGFKVDQVLDNTGFFEHVLREETEKKKVFLGEGEINKGGRPLRPIEDRFWEKVEKTNTCWLWTGTKQVPQGYGRFSVRIAKSTNKWIGAHRVSYALHYGEFDNKLLVCHTCDVRLCVKPEHLFLGTAKDNAEDMVKKGRHVGNRT